MNKKTMLAIAAIAAAVLYWRLTLKDYYAVHEGMTGAEIVDKLGSPRLKTNHEGMDIWFYGISNREDHVGTFGTAEASFNADCAVLFGQNSDRVIHIDRSAEKEWVVSIPKSASP